MKTIEFGRKIYLGDPVNIAKIFSDLGADEIIYLDISKDRFKQRAGLWIIAAHCTPMFHADDIWRRHLQH